MKYAFNNSNILRSAILVALGIIPSQAYYAESVSRTGGGRVVLTGDYTGQDDAKLELEIINSTIVGAPRTSKPARSGVGNGTMSDVAADSGVAAQEFKVTLQDVGTRTRKAYTPFQGTTLCSRVAGSSGNDITITVDDSAIVRTPADSALQEPLSKDVNEYTGQHWDFGAKVLTPEGGIPDDAPRISFGDDPEIYRQYKVFRDGRYTYSFSPVPRRSVDAGARVKTVTGTHTVTVTDGSTTNTYTDITSLYSLLIAIRGDPAGLLEVDGPVVLDRAPQGMGVTEMNERTVSFVQSVVRDGTPYVKSADLDLTIAEDAPTETFELQCINADFAGREEWALNGTVSGELLNAVTGVPYSDGPLSFTIEEVLPPSVAPAAGKSAYLELESRSDTEAQPQLCVRDFLIGAEARPVILTYVWRPRLTDCSCINLPIEGRPDDDLLGVDTGGTSVGSIPAFLRTRLNNLAEWQKTFVASNATLLAYDASIAGDSTQNVDGIVVAQAQNVGVDGTYDAQRIERVSGILKADRVDIDCAQKVFSIFGGELDFLNTEIGEPASDNQDLWDSALALWDTHFADMQSDLNTIADVPGAEFWRKYSTYVINNTSPANSTSVTGAADISVYGAALLTQEIDTYLSKWRTAMTQVRVAAGVMPNFDQAARTGNAAWRDFGGAAWFESQEGYLPIQPGHYYHSAKLDDDGNPFSTREFGIGVVIGCELKYGDKLIIKIDPKGNLRTTYQEGDKFTIETVNGAPIQLGGGQTGTDVLTWSVIGDEDGAHADYELSLTAPVAYDDGGISFLITPGGIDFGLGFEFSFFVEGGQFRYRFDEGAWSADTQIDETVALGLGLSAQFVAGAAPSFEPGDFYTFAIEAVNGPARAIAPTDGAMAWDADLSLTISPEYQEEPTDLVIASHTIPSGAEITLQGSNDGFATTPLEESVEWHETHIHHVIENQGAYSEFRLLVSLPGSAQWIWLGTPYVPMIPSADDLGDLVRQIRLPTPLLDRANGFIAQHSALTQDSVDSLEEGLSHATLNDEGRLFIVPNDDEPGEVGVVEYDEEALELTEVQRFQPRERGYRLVNVSLPLRPVA